MAFSFVRCAIIVLLSDDFSLEQSFFTRRDIANSVYGTSYEQPEKTIGFGWCRKCTHLIFLVTWAGRTKTQSYIILQPHRNKLSVEYVFITAINMTPSRFCGEPSQLLGLHLCCRCLPTIHGVIDWSENQ
eukprot:scaffold3571_cov176-Amphora_coffeaeformis.AAC.9